MFYKISILFFLAIFSSSLYSSEIITPPKGYSLNAELTNASILLGETTELTLIYRYKDVEDYEIEEPEFSNIIVKELSSNDYKDRNGYFVEEIRYSLKPLKAGNFSLKNMQVHTQIIDVNYKNFDNRSKYTKKFTLTAKSISLKVKKLPEGISAIGKYRLSATVDKSHVKQGEIVTLRISLDGKGNIQNLDALKPHIKNATTYLLYTTKSKRQHLQTKVYEIVSDRAYTIPSFELSYFDKEDMSVKKSRTKLIEIGIEGYTQTQIKVINDLQKYIFFFLGALSILVLIFIYTLLTKKRVKKEAPFVKTLKSCHNRSDFYKKSVVYLGRDKILDELIYKLESADYKSFKNLKKRIIINIIKTIS